MSHPRKNLDHYLDLQFPCEVIPSDEGGFVVHHPELPGCAAQGEDLQEALTHLSEARQLWLQANWEDNHPIPEPASSEPSGRLMLRMPIRLQVRLDRLATRYGVSLNRLLNEMLFNYANALPPLHGLTAVATDIESPKERRYSYRLTPLPSGGFVAEHVDLPGCFSEGVNAAEAVANLDEARALWIEGRHAEDLPVPEPLSAKHTGLVHLRMPPALHAALARDARRNGSTLNSHLCFALLYSPVTDALNPDLVRSETIPSSARLQATRRAIRQELDQLKMSVGQDFLDSLQLEYASFLLGLIYMRHKLFEKASPLIWSALGGDFDLDKLRELVSFVRKDLGGFNLERALLPIVHAFPPRLTEEDDNRCLIVVELLRSHDQYAQTTTLQ